MLQVDRYIGHTYRTPSYRTWRDLWVVKATGAAGHRASAPRAIQHEQYPTRIPYASVVRIECRLGLISDHQGSRSVEVLSVP